MLIVSAIEVLDLHIGGFSHVLGQIGTECDACVVSFFFYFLFDQRTVTHAAT